MWENSKGKGIECVPKPDRGLVTLLQDTKMQKRPEESPTETLWVEVSNQRTGKKSPNVRGIPVKQRERD